MKKTTKTLFKDNNSNDFGGWEYHELNPSYDGSSWKEISESVSLLFRNWFAPYFGLINFYSIFILIFVSFLLVPTAKAHAVDK